MENGRDEDIKLSDNESRMAVHLSESEKETPHGKQSLNLTAGRPMYILKCNKWKELLSYIQRQ